MNSVEFQWDGKTDNWASMCERLIAYKKNITLLLFPNDAKKITSSDYGYITSVGFVY